jgi:hypothetical protein
MKRVIHHRLNHRLNHRLIPIFATMIALASCGKKTSDIGSAAAQSKDVAALYTSITDSLSTLHITGYGTTNLNFMDETWTDNSWGTTVRFACPDTKCSGNITAKGALDANLDSARGGVNGTLKTKINPLCYVGALIPATEIGTDFLPVVGAKHQLSVDDVIVAKLTSNCGMSTSAATAMKTVPPSLTVEDPEGDSYDRYVVFSTGGTDAKDYPFYIKNSDGYIRMAIYDGNTSGSNSTHGISRVLIEKDLATDIFRFELFGRIAATGQTESTGGDLTFSRGYLNNGTKELSFITDFGTAYYQANHTFMGLSTNSAAANAGAYFSRTSADSTAFTGAFVCFKKSDGTFINGTGCTDSAADDRRRVWNSSASLFVTIDASTQASWALAATSVVKNFDASSILTLAP